MNTKRFSRCRVWVREANGESPRRSSVWSRGWVGVVILSVVPVALWAQGEFTRLSRIVPDVVALARQAMLTLPAPPDWEAATKPAVWTIEEMKAEFAGITDTPPPVNFIRTTFLRPDHAWMLRFKTWFRKLEKPLKMHYEDQLWDCDNYANCFVAFADLVALRSGETRGAFCVGWATVNYQRAFAGVRAGGAHAVVIVGTSKGLFVIEPQDGTMVALRDFPNRHTIEAVYF